jgi:hypothetical protein
MNAMNVDFGLIRPPDYVGDYANAFAAGRRMAGATAPASVTNPFSAPGGGDMATAVAAMSEGQRQAAAQRAEALAAVLAGLKGASADPAARLAMARHVAAVTPALGIAPAAIAGADVTDEGLARHLAGALSLGAMLRDGAADPSPLAGETHSPTGDG